MDRFRISLVIPVLNEEIRIRAAVERARALRGIHEVIIVDGGSDDRTVDIARGLAGVRVVASERGRARQMNAGAALATGDALLFLHADVSLPDDAAYWVQEALSEPGTVAGAFRTWTVVDDGASRAWAPLLHLADLRSRYTALPYGDQALFVQAREFLAAGGFPDLPLMEDLALARALRRRGRIRTVGARVRVSGRRFLARPIFYTFLVNVYPALFRLGVSADLLARFYRHVR